MRAAFALLLAAGLSATPATADEYLKSRAPKAHIDGFLNECRRKAPDASCRCMARELSSTRDGDFVLDLSAPALRAQQQPGSVKQEALLAALNRHGLKASEGKAIAGRGPSILKAAANACV